MDNSSSVDCKLYAPKTLSVMIDGVFYEVSSIKEIPELKTVILTLGRLGCWDFFESIATKQINFTMEYGTTRYCVCKISNVTDIVNGVTLQAKINYEFKNFIETDIFIGDTKVTITTVKLIKHNDFFSSNPQQFKDFTNSDEMFDIYVLVPRSSEIWPEILKFARNSHYYHFKTWYNLECTLDYMTSDNPYPEEIKNKLVSTITLNSVRYNNCIIHKQDVTDLLSGYTNNFRISVNV